jgi:putative inorganic carbon (hco3(-)) transporter
MLKAGPLIGVGYGEFVEHYNLTAHNSLVLCFAETGLVGYSIWVAFIILTLVQLQWLGSRANDTTGAEHVRWASALQLANVGFMAGAFFLSRSFVPMSYLISGLSVALVLIFRRRAWPGAPVPIAILCVLIAATEVASIGVIYAAVKLHIV